MHGLNSARVIAVAVPTKRRARLVRVPLMLQRVTMMIRLARATPMSIQHVFHKNVNQTRIVMRIMPVPHHRQHQMRRKTCQLGQCEQPIQVSSPRIWSRALVACALPCSGPRDRCPTHAPKVFPYPTSLTLALDFAFDR